MVFGLIQAVLIYAKALKLGHDGILLQAPVWYGPLDMTSSHFTMEGILTASISIVDITKVGFRNIDLHNFANLQRKPTDDGYDLLSSNGLRARG